MQKLKFYCCILLTVIVVITLMFDISLFYGMNFAVNKLDVHYQKLTDPNIPTSLNDTTIVYFSDLLYGKFENDQRTKKVIDQINDLHPDILLFGGDLFDDQQTISKAEKKKMLTYLSSIEAPLGKFAVWGEKDTSSKERKALMNDIYKKAQIEVLDNARVTLGNQSASGIRLIGLTDTKNIDKTMENISSKTYNLLMTHQPDHLVSESLSNKSISLALAGHAHATQVTYPILGAYRQVKGSTELNRANTKDLAFPYILTSGVGCTHRNIRFKATPELYYFILRSA